MTLLKRLARGALYALGMLVAIAAGLLEMLDDLFKPARRPRR